MLLSPHLEQHEQAVVSAKLGLLIDGTYVN